MLFIYRKNVSLCFKNTQNTKRLQKRQSNVVVSKSYATYLKTQKKTYPVILRILGFLSFSSRKIIHNTWRPLSLPQYHKLAKKKAPIIPWVWHAQLLSIPNPVTWSGKLTLHLLVQALNTLKLGWCLNPGWLKHLEKKNHPFEASWFWEGPGDEFKV